MLTMNEMTPMVVASDPVAGGCREDITGDQSLRIEGPAKAEIREALQRSHGILLRRAGIHPEYPSHQARLCRLVDRACADYEGDVETIVIIKVGFYWYAFGGNARQIREAKWNTKYEPTWLCGNFEVIGQGVIVEVMRLLMSAGLRVAVVEIPRDCPEQLEAPPVPWETDPTPRPVEVHPMDER